MNIRLTLMPDQLAILRVNKQLFIKTCVDIPEDLNFLSIKDSCWSTKVLQCEIIRRKQIAIGWAIDMILLDCDPMRVSCRGNEQVGSIEQIKEEKT